MSGTHRRSPLHALVRQWEPVGRGSPRRTGSPRRAVALAVAALVLASPAVADAAPRFRTLVLHAASSAHLDVTLTRTVTVDSWNLKVRGGGDFAGFYFQPLKGAPEAGAGTVLLRKFDAAGFHWQPLPVGHQDFKTFAGREGFPTLAPGRYRLHVLSNTPVEVRVPVAGFATAKPLRATRRTVVNHLVSDVTDEWLRGPSPAVPGGVGRADLPFSVPSRRTISFAALQVVSSGIRWFRGSMGACLESADHPQCLNEDAKQFDGYSSPEYVFRPAENTVRASNVFVRYYFPSGADPAQPGEQRAYYFSASTLHVERVVAAALSISL